MATTAIPITNYLGVNDYMLGQWAFGAAKNGVLVLLCVGMCISTCCFPIRNDEEIDTLAGIGCTAFFVVWILQIVMVADQDYGPANGCGYID